MQKNATLKVFVVIAILLLSVAISCLQISYATANSASTQKYSSIQLNYGSLDVNESKMTSTQVKDYENAAGIYQEGNNYNQIIAGHGTGLAPPTSIEWTQIANNAYVVNSISASTPPPPVVDQTTSPYFPPIGDQGQQGSCASFSISYYCKTFQEAKDHQWNLTGAQWINNNISLPYQSEVMSPAFVYNTINNGIDGGSDFETPIRLICNVGISSWQNMPYNQHDYTTWPSLAAWNQAPQYRSNSTFSYEYLYTNTTEGITNLKNWLAAGNLASVAVDATDNLMDFHNSQDLFTTNIYINGDLDHAATIVGYNDSFVYTENGAVHYGAFKIANSWGKGGWETIPDGCYWISYDLMAELTSRPDDPVEIFTDLTGYQPQVLATFNITHSMTSDLNITFGLGTPSVPIITKSFTDYVFGGNKSFCSSNVVFDLTEFKDYLTSLYNQPFFMQVHDIGPNNGGTSDTGTINYFAIGNTSSTQASMATIKDQTVTLTLNYSFASPTIAVTPTSGASSGAITLNGVGFAGSSVNISYLNPTTSAWIPIVNNQSLSSENFSYAMHAPDLLQNSPAGDNPPCSNNLTFRVQDNSNGNAYNTSVPYTEWRRGLNAVGNQTAGGLYGNSTTLATTMFVQNNQSLTVAGQWFNPGTATLFWDGNVSLGTSAIDANGAFNANVAVPNTSAGQHTITINDGNANFCINLTRLPAVTNDYVAGSWHTSDIPVTFTSDFNGCETFYSINNGSVCNVSANGQPVISVESANNTLEFWSTWNIYGTGSMQLQHILITGIQLEKTPSQGSIHINYGAAQTTSTSVAITINVASLSGVSQMRFSNDNTWNAAPWETYATSKTWQLTSGEGAKTVYCQIKDNAGLVATFSGSINLIADQTTSPTATPTPSNSPSPSPTPQAPELSLPMMLALLAFVTLAIAINTRRSARTKNLAPIKNA